VGHSDTVLRGAMIQVIRRYPSIGKPFKELYYPNTDSVMQKRVSDWYTLGSVPSGGQHVCQGDPTFVRVLNVCSVCKVFIGSVRGLPPRHLPGAS
jgi:hypothetical protein